MNCPFCGHGSSRVVDSRDQGGNSIRRRRLCNGCGRRYSTRERIEYRLPDVIKKGGNRQAFSREKLLAGIALACRKRPVMPDTIEEAADRVARKIFALGVKEINSQEVGQKVLEELLEIDRVAYLRFASVYQELTGPEQFLELLQPLLEER